jgi:hypothetical protein
LVLQMLPRFSFPTNKVRNPKSQKWTVRRFKLKV